MQVIEMKGAFIYFPFILCDACNLFANTPERLEQCGVCPLWCYTPFLYYPFFYSI